MNNTLFNRRDMEFMLYEMLDAEALTSRPRFEDHSREVFDAILSTAETIAEKYFADHYHKGDANEPTFDGEKVHLIPETETAWKAVADAGFMAAHQDFDEGGMQLPAVVISAAMSMLSGANIGSSAYHFLTIGSANLIRSFGSDEQKAKFLPPMMDGRFSGTMALTEPGQGSALADITTTAEPQADGTYRIKGQKMYISNGDHDLTDNIVHLALAKIKGAPDGVHGISLFIVPKFLVNDDGSIGERNDVALAGLLHKMGYRNATSTVLNFGEKDGAIGYLVGEPHRGLGYMFQMMNEARIGVGSGAAALAYRGYLYALNYAQERPQGRLPSNKNPSSKQVMIIEHADVRRMLLTQKTYAEGALALCFYASSLIDDSLSKETEAEKQRAEVLLDLLTPIVKSWPSKYGCICNDIAIQVLGGSGYIREYPVEQLYRDQRLNPIHEGTEGIQALDLLGRKVPMQNKYGYDIFKQEIRITLTAAAEFGVSEDLLNPVYEAIDRLDEVTDSLLLGLAKDADRGLANATHYMDMFGRVVMSWIWLKQAVVAAKALAANKGKLTQAQTDFYQGKVQAARFYIECELPQTKQQAELLLSNNQAAFDMKAEWF